MNECGYYTFYLRLIVFFFLIIKKFLKNVCIYIPIETPPKKQKIFILFRVELLKH